MNFTSNELKFIGIQTMSIWMPAFSFAKTRYASCEKWRNIESIVLKSATGSTLWSYVHSYNVIKFQYSYYKSLDDIAASLGWSVEYRIVSIKENIISDIDINNLDK